MAKSVLFVINGFGMGNATRCESLIETLGEDYRADVITSDRALKYFRNNPRVRQVFGQRDINLGKSLRYGSPEYYLRYIPHFFRRLLLNYSFQKSVMNSRDYDAVIFDSDYGFILHRLFGLKKNRILGLNNSFEILRYFARRPAEIRPSFLASLSLELFDFTAYYLFCKKVICPCLDTDTALNSPGFGKISLTPPLVRGRLLRAGTAGDGLLIMGTSSKVESFLPGSFEFDNTRALSSARRVVCNAGQSSLSECLYLGKNTLVAPLPGHAEQYVNSRIAQSKGFKIFDPRRQSLDSALNLLEKPAPKAPGYDYAANTRLLRNRLAEGFL